MESPRILFRSAFTALALTLLLSACAVTRKAELESAVETYVKALRVGDESGKMMYVHPNQAKTFSKNAKKLESLEVSNAEVKSIFPDEKMQKALVTIFVEYYSQSASTVVNAQRNLNWTYDEKAKAWFLDEASPFGTN